MKELIFINACPHDPYFQWQQEVLITNFRKHGISDKMHICVWYKKGSEHLQKWADLQQKYPEVSFFYYEDQGVDLKLYIPQLRPHILKMHFAENKEILKDKVFFYHDADIIFNYLPDFEELIKGEICWESNASSYLDYDYFERKEIQGKIPDGEIIKTMANIGGIPVDVIKKYSGKTGGAQYVLKGIDSSFWQDVEDMSIKIRKAFAFEIEGSINRKYFTSENEGLQSWCADMWAVNFSLWKRDIPTDVTPQLEFSWATDTHETFLKKPIFHNAGASGAPGIFYKGHWISKSPIGVELEIPAENTASYEYVKAIMEVNNV